MNYVNTDKNNRTRRTVRKGLKIKYFMYFFSNLFTRQRKQVFIKLRIIQLKY